MSKRLLSLALALTMCLGLTIPAFATEPEWKIEILGKSDAEVFVGQKTFTLRDCGMYDYDPSIDEEIFYKEDDLQFTVENLCVLAKGDTAVFTYTYNDGYAYSTQVINLTAWSDTDGDGVYDKRTIKINFSDKDDYSDGQNGYVDLLPGNKYEVLPVGSAWTGHPWSASVNRDEEGRHEVRLSADKVLELFGPNTLVGFSDRGIDTSDPAEMDWFILVEGDTTVPAVGGFTDVKAGDYFADPVQWAVEKGITAGTSATTFSPNATCTQGQILTFLWRAKGEPNPTGTVSGTQYYATAAQWAKEQGLTDNFSAEADCTRAMVVTYLWKLAGSPNAGTSDFTDVPANADYAQAVAWAVEQGVTAGTSDTTFSPDSVCTRGQIVTFLYRNLAK